MTMWAPDLSRLKGPDYQRLADAIRRDIEAGRLQPGDRLPPQANMTLRRAPSAPSSTVFIHVAAPTIPSEWERYLGAAA